MIKPTKRKVKKVAKKSRIRLNPDEGYGFSSITTHFTRDGDLKYEIDEFLNKKVEVRFEFGKRSGGEIFGKLGKNKDNIYFVSNIGFTNIETRGVVRKSENKNNFYFHLDDVGLIDSRPDILKTTPIIIIGKRLTERYIEGN